MMRTGKVGVRYGSKDYKDPPGPGYGSPLRGDYSPGTPIGMGPHYKPAPKPKPPPPDKFGDPTQGGYRTPPHPIPSGTLKPAPAMTGKNGKPLRDRVIPKSSPAPLPNSYDKPRPKRVSS